MSFNCLVFEQLEVNLFELLHSRRFPDRTSQCVGLNLDVVRLVGCQVLVALCLMGLPNVNIIHSDLKPENLMLISDAKAGIKIIDFGNACFANQKI